MAALVGDPELVDRRFLGHIPQDGVDLVGTHTGPLGDGHELSARNYYLWRDFANRLPFVAGGRVEFDRFFAGGGVSYAHDGFWLDRPNRLVVGLDFDRQADDRKRFDNEMGLTGALAFDQKEIVRSEGLFVHNELRVTRDLELTLGVRLDRVTFDVRDRFLADGDDSGKRTLHDTSPMVGLVYTSMLFMVVPLVTTLDSLDDSLIEVGYDLGGSGFAVLREIVVPHAMPGIVAGFLLTAVRAWTGAPTPTAAARRCSVRIKRSGASLQSPG